MGLNIVTSMQPLNVENIITFIYGDPGIWKTSLAFTAKNPILFDFDKGAQRASNRRDSVQINDWSEVKNFNESELAGYDTIIIDTGGRCTDEIERWLKAQGGKNTKYDGELSIQGYGKLKNEFIGWLKKLRGMRKDIVLLAHAAEDKKGDETVMRPEMPKSSRAEAYKVADIMGYMTVQNDGKKTVHSLNFNYNTTYLSKDSGRIGNVVVMPMQDAPNQLANIIQATKDHINSLSAEAAKAQKELDDLRNDLLDAETTSDLDELKADLKIEHPLYLEMAKSIMSRSKALGFIYDKPSNSFVEPEPVVEDADFEPANEQEAEVANVE